MIEFIAKSKTILSTSLHCLVIADSLGVENEWMNSNGIHRADRFELYDYESAIGRAINTPFPLKTVTNIHKAVMHSQITSHDYFNNIDDINANLKRLLKSQYL